MPARSAIIEFLESRTLLSVSPATLSQDQAQLRTDLTKLAMDKNSAAVVLDADKARVKADGGAHNPALEPLRNAFKQDLLARATTLAMDRTSLKVTTDSDKIAILEEKQQIHTDAGNPNALAADKVTLNADELKLATDRATLATQLNSDNLSTRTTDLNARIAITSAIKTGGTNSALANDRATLIVDTSTWATTEGIDKQNIIDDRLKIAEDRHG